MIVDVILGARDDGGSPTDLFEGLADWSVVVRLARVSNSFPNPSILIIDVSSARGKTAPHATTAAPQTLSTQREKVIGANPGRARYEARIALRSVR